MLTSYVYGCVNKCSPVVDECLEKLPFIPGVDSSALFFSSTSVAKRRNMLASRWVARAAQSTSRLPSVRLLSPQANNLGHTYVDIQPFIRGYASASPTVAFTGNKGSNVSCLGRRDGSSTNMSSRESIP